MFCLLNLKCPHFLFSIELNPQYPILLLVKSPFSPMFRWWNQYVPYLFVASLTMFPTICWLNHHVPYLLVASLTIFPSCSPQKTRLFQRVKSEPHHRPPALRRPRLRPGWSTSSSWYRPRCLGRAAGRSHRAMMGHGLVRNIKGMLVDVSRCRDKSFHCQCLLH